ncbi:hypothetical protein A0H81_14566 [Grifola frondosa]|uniref:Uncharacterized protein n=1 Tax=Grifola frondosa TaxID=5627 RepID=A0A1C7LKW5_GRIFR|nr:hypothetical protein A0H81_14566 [Grifola frondosa]
MKMVTAKDGTYQLQLVVSPRAGAHVFYEKCQPKSAESIRTTRELHDQKERISWSLTNACCFSLLPSALDLGNSKSNASTPALAV